MQKCLTSDNAGIFTLIYLCRGLNGIKPLVFPARRSYHTVHISETFPSVVDKVAHFALAATLSLLFKPILSIFFGPLFQFFLIFQQLRCSSTLKRPWGLQVLSFVSHFLLKLFFFNPVRLLTVVVLALSTLSRFLSLSFCSPPIFLCVSQRSMLYFFSSACKKAGGYLCQLLQPKNRKKD